MSAAGQIEGSRRVNAGQRSAQWGLFEADTLYADFVGKRNFYGYLASQRDELFHDEDFAGLYQKIGRPSVPPSLMATALVLQAYDGVSDDEAKQRADYDLRWKVALGIELEVRPFAKSTLQEFRAQLIVHDQTRAIFQRSLEVAKHRGTWKKGHAPDVRQHMKLALDTTNILGRGAVKDTYNLLADGIVQVLRVLAKLGPFELLDVAEELGCTQYLQGPSLKGQADVDWTNPQARQRFLAEIVADAEGVLGVVRGTRADLTADSAEDKELVGAAEVLARILGQDIERDEGGPRLKQGVASDRLISVHDPEMRHGRKSSSHRFNGHKAQIGVDTDLQLITALDVLAGNAPDAAGAGGDRGERSGHWLAGRGGAWRLCLWRRQHAGRIRGEETDDRRQGARHQEPGVLRQDRVSDRSGGWHVHLPESAGES